MNNTDIYIKYVQVYLVFFFIKLAHPPFVDILLHSNQCVNLMEKIKLYYLNNTIQ